MGLCLIYGVTLTFSLPKTHKINYIIFRSSCKKGCSLSAGWSRLVGFSKGQKGCEKAPSPHTWREPDILPRFAVFSKPGSDERYLFNVLMDELSMISVLRWNWMLAGIVVIIVVTIKKQKKTVSIQKSCNVTEANPRQPEDEEAVRGGRDVTWYSV